MLNQFSCSFCKNPETFNNNRLLFILWQAEAEKVLVKKLTHPDEMFI